MGDEICPKMEFHLPAITHKRVYGDCRICLFTLSILGENVLC